MPRPALAAIAVVFVGLAAEAAAQEARPQIAAALASLEPMRQPSGLLLGLRDGQDYRTLYLVHGGGRVTLVADLPFILSPQNDGFWRLGVATAWPQGCTRRFCDPDHEECADDTCRFAITRIWQSPSLAGPVPQPSAATLEETLRESEGRDLGGSAYYRREERIEYVARGALCRSAEGHGYTGGAHDFFDQDTHCFAIGADLRWDEPLDYPMPVAAGSAALGKTLEALVAAARDGAFEEVEGAAPEPQVMASIRDAVASGGLQFRLDRADGQTQLSLTAASSASFAASPTYTLTVAAPYGAAGTPFVAHNPPPTAFHALQAVERGLVDLFVSPSEAVVFALTERSLSAIEPKSGVALWSAPVTFDRVVMVEWATGADIERWAAAAAAARAP